jgi:proline iminopeptidase
VPLYDVGDTRLYVDDRGNPDGPALVILHGGPGLDHTMFGTALDPLGDEYRLLLVDQREQGRSDRGTPAETWTLAQLAADVDALGVEPYAVLGHSYGAFVALQHALDSTRPPVATIISSGLPSERWLEDLEETLATFEPEDLREQVAASWEAEKTVEDQDGERRLVADQMPFHFADPRDPRIEEVDVADMIFSPAVTRAAASGSYGAIEVEDRLGEIAHPVLVMTGRHDRLCTAPAAEFMAERIPGAQLEILEHSAHMGFIEEPEAYLSAVRSFLDRTTRGSTSSR